MSHEAGFRRGGQDFRNKRAFGGGRPRVAKREFEQRLAERFHEHEKEAKHPTQRGDAA